jgi:hypothetical protein
MENNNTTTEQKELIVETHLFTALRYNNSADAGFSGNVALLVEAVQHSDKVLDENLKVLAKGIFDSVIQHKIIKIDMDEVRRYKEAQEKKKKDDMKIEEIVKVEVIDHEIPDDIKNGISG